jgi:hypothetical protein
VAVSNGTTTFWRKGDPATTRSGGDQRLGPGDRVAGQVSVDSATTCVTWNPDKDAAIFELQAPCDAATDADSARPGVQNKLTVWVDDIDIGESDRALVPCPDGCTLTFDCAADTTTDLTFDGAVVYRGGGAGFADTADTFDFAWCSAKYDSCQILLHDEGGKRVETGILAVACIGRKSVQVVDLARVALVCDTHRFDLAPIGEGLLEATSNGASLAFAAYVDEEDLTNTIIKQYFNLAFRMPDLAALGEDCHVEWAATTYDPSRAIFAADRPAADGLVYPFLTTRVPVTEQGELVCEVSSLDDRRFMDSKLYGNTGGHDALPPRCFSARGKTVTATGAPGCAE